VASRTLALDLDGTLVDSVPDIMAALNRMMARLGTLPFSRAQTVAMIGDGLRVLAERAFQARSLPFDEASCAALQADYTAHAAVDTAAFPGVVEGLRTLQDHGWRFAVCTNKPEAAAIALLDGLGLRPWFAAVGGGDSFPTRKPDPAHLAATLAAAGGSADQAVMVGDHRNDVLAAAGLGIPCIFAGWGYGTTDMAQGAAIAASFADVPALAETLLRHRPARV
jgi:phosphoglycolate phosphatase